MLWSFEDFVFASCNIKNKEEVSLLMTCHMNEKNKKWKFETEWELINKEKKRAKKGSQTCS